MIRFIVAVTLMAFISGCAAKQTPPVEPALPREPSLAEITFPSVLDVPSLEKVDPETAEEESGLDWFDGRQFTIEGRPWDDTLDFWERLPARAQAVVTDPVWDLRTNTAGIVVRFVTDSPTITAAWNGGGAMNHMAATGNSGLDLYAKRNGRWQYAGTGRPQPARTVYTIASGQPATPTEYMLCLPLYGPITELKIGLQPGSLSAKAPPRPAERRKPIVFYGTSITQGGCASRAGMAHTGIISRWLDRPVINLGFSGSGKMEMAMADLLAELDPAVYVLDCLPNMTLEMVGERIEPFVRRLRESHPQTPILLVSSPLRGVGNEQNPLLFNIYKHLQHEGVPNVYFLSGREFLWGLEEATVDGIHPTDLGFYRMAVVFYPVLKKLAAE